MSTPRPIKPFLFSETDKRQFTYKQFEAAVQRTARMLAAHGVGKGDVVSLLLPNSVEYVIAYFACWQIGALAGPINSLLKSQEIAYVISNSEAKALLVNSEFLPVVETIRNELPSLQAVILFDNEADATSAYSEGADTDRRYSIAITKQLSSTRQAPPENPRAVCSHTET